MATRKEAIRSIEKEKDAYRKIIDQHINEKQYYRNLLFEIAKIIGDEAFNGPNMVAYDKIVELVKSRS